MYYFKIFTIFQMQSYYLKLYTILVFHHLFIPKDANKLTLFSWKNGLAHWTLKQNIVSTFTFNCPLLSIRLQNPWS